MEKVSGKEESSRLIDSVCIKDVPIFRILFQESVRAPEVQWVEALGEWSRIFVLCCGFLITGLAIHATY